MSPAAGRLFGSLFVIIGGMFANVARAQQADAGAPEQTVRVAPQQAVRFAVRGNDLAVSTDLKPAPDEHLDLKLDGLDGTAQVERGRRFIFNYTDIDDDHGRSEQVNIVAGGSRVQIVRMMRDREGASTMTLIQDGSGLWRRGRSLEPRNERISLRVRTNQRFGGPPIFQSQVDVRAASFDELLRKYPGVCNKHLVPLFREFNQDEIVFRVDGHLAWQLFPDAFTADDATKSKVLALIERLDSKDFRERELATTELDVIGGPAVVVLSGIDRTPLSPEQRTRIDSILARFNRLDTDDVTNLLNDSEFLLRCFIYGESEPIRAAAVKLMSQKYGADKTAPLKPADALAQRLAAADEVRGHLPLPPAPQE
jgi:hypothetical protein